MTTNSKGPTSDASDPLGPSIQQPAATGEPITPGQHDDLPADESGPGTDRHAGNIREEQGTHAAGTVPASHIGEAGRRESPASAADAPGRPEEALLDPDAADDEPGR